MKYKTTRKAVNKEYPKKICAGYGVLQNLLCYESEVAYITRSEGWAADIYDFGNTAIITGYDPFGNFNPGYEVCHKYDTQARQLLHDHLLPWQKSREKVRELLRQFIEEVTQ